MLENTMIAPPRSLLKPIHVPEKLLTGPGPSNASERVLKASSLPILGHLHTEFITILDDVKAGIKYAFQTKNEVTLAISATGHGAMEAACCNMVEPGDVVLVAENGLWGQRFRDVAERHDAVVISIHKPAGEVFTDYEIKAALQTYQPRILFITHGESSGTTCQPLELIGKLCHDHKCLLIVDSVAALGAVPLFMDEWQIDVLYSGSQKALSAPPGLGLISFSPAAWKKIQERKTKVRSFYFDMNWLANYWGCDGKLRRYHHTAPVNMMYALREALSELVAEGLTSSWERHRKSAELLYAGLKQMGLELFVKVPNVRLPLVTGVILPKGVDWKKVVRLAMINGVEISGGLGPTAGLIWRIGLMGQNARPEIVQRVLTVLKESIQKTKTSSKL